MSWTVAPGKQRVIPFMKRMFLVMEYPIIIVVVGNEEIERVGYLDGTVDVHLPSALSLTVLDRVSAQETH